jgi:hypothetical protein
MANEVCANPALLKLLVDIMLNEKQPTSWRAAWIIDHSAQIDKSIIAPYLPKFIKLLPNIRHHGVQRHLLRMIAYSGNTEIIDGNTVSLCFEWLQSELTSIASKAFCMDILTNVAKHYPELLPEYIIVLEELEINGSRGIKNKATKLLKKFHRLNND